MPSELLHGNMIAIYFGYGLAFFVLGLATALEARRSPAIKMASGLWFLAAFGLIHASAEWLEMFLLINTDGSTLQAIFLLRVLKVILLATSAFALVYFGVKLIIATDQGLRWLRWLPVGLFSAWLVSFVVPHLGAAEIGVAGGAANGSGLCGQCHWGQASTYVAASGEWITSADIWARYLLYFPGSLLAGLALVAQRPLFRQMGLPRIARSCAWAAAAFLFNGLVAGWIVPPAPYFPASILNYATFTEIVRVPPQVFRMGAGFVITVFVLHILRVFEIEHNRQLQNALQDRLAAQQGAIETQTHAREEIERLNRELEARVSQRTKELEGLNRIATGMSALLNLDRILNTVVEKARELLATDVALLSLLDEARGEVSVRAVSGARTEAFRSVALQIGHGVSGRSVATRQPVIVEDYCGEAAITHELDGLITEEGLRTHMAVPLKIGDHVLGVLYVARRVADHFSPSDVELASRLANHAAIAIHNARLYEQVQSLAVLEERERIAREMHDSLASALGYLSLKASAVADLLDAGEATKAKAEVKRMERAAQDAYADVRESILGLRTTISAEHGLEATLSEYLKKFGLHNRIRCELLIDAAAGRHLSPATEIQLMRIIQEALTNVRKHANATQAWVRFEHNCVGTEVTIEDNGCGFDPSHLSYQDGQHFGMETMRERAQSVGGTLEVDSSPGLGTRVIVRLKE